MIETALRQSLAELTGIPVYPLLLPPDCGEGVTYQRISDPRLEDGLVVTTLVRARFQVTFYLVGDYPGILALDKKVRQAWESVVHDKLGGLHVQTVQRAGIQQDTEVLNDGRRRYRLARDFIITYSEADEP
ncbi:hypothetical protein E0G79_26095 [Salmonella enterica]|nr:hypothetical protein [Salmonella enterica]EBA9765548.1 hypothetical protein [Salmonella enterica]EEB5699301.1 hypothetical protein [Salmonella enterica]EGX5144515.1 hypothetical protein [Salmonella enterica]ELF4900212.1 hypothetical protein [Salmonella enterica]